MADGENKEQINPQQVELDEDSNVDHDEATRQLREGEARAVGALPAAQGEGEPGVTPQAETNPFDSE